MIKRALTASSFLLGGAGMIFVAHLAMNPLAFTYPVAPSPVTVAASPEARVAAESPAESGPFVLPEITIVASLETTSRGPARTATLDPCSGWGEVGALFIEPSGASGVRNVRRLCQR